MEDEVREFHPAVKLLLARMESNPEEFEHPNNKWAGVYQNSVEHWLPEEKRAYKTKLREIRMRITHEKIMHKLLVGEVAQPETVIVEEYKKGKFK